MTSVNDIFKKLAETSSRLEKESILRKNEGNRDLYTAIALALNPLTNFYIKKIPEYQPGAQTNNEHRITLYEAMVRITNELSTRKITGNDAIALLKYTLESVEPDEAKVLERIIKKDLRCGVSEATANKVWENLIPTYPVMLCSPYEQKSIDKIKFPAFVQLKMDGMRFNAVVRNGKVTYFSRNGKMLDLLGHLDEDFIKAANCEELDHDRYSDFVVFDGELWVGDILGFPLPRQTSNGILAKCQKGTITDEEASQIYCTLWDVIPYKDFTAGKCTTPYSERFLELEKRVQSFVSNKLKIVLSYNVYSLEEAKLLFEQYLSEGQEGIILKDMSAPWEDKRVKHQIKFKGEQDCDLRCVGWEEGTGKNKGKLGALILESEDGALRVSVGTGFTDSMRETITEQEVVGKIVAIKYNARISDKKTGQHSLFLPVFIEVRTDKETADSSSEIK